MTELDTVKATPAQISTAISDHGAASDPHPGYLTAAEGNAAFDPAGAADAAEVAAAAALAANASVTSTLVLVEGGETLGNLDFGSLALVGLGLGSGASAFADWRSARDNNDSATKPNIVP